MTDLLELPSTHEEVTAFSIRRWEEVLADPELRTLSGQVETDQFGRILMSLPAAYDHGSLKIEESILDPYTILGCGVHRFHSPPPTA